MTDEELDRARAEEGIRRLQMKGAVPYSGSLGTLVARLDREEWRPPTDPLEMEVEKIADGWGHTRAGIRRALKRGIELGRERMTGEGE